MSREKNHRIALTDKFSIIAAHHCWHSFDIMLEPLEEAMKVVRADLSAAAFYVGWPLHFHPVAPVVLKATNPAFPWPAVVSPRLGLVLYTVLLDQVCQIPFLQRIRY
jgi:hypothetical protein